MGQILSALFEGAPPTRKEQAEAVVESDSPKNVSIINESNTAVAKKKKESVENEAINTTRSKEIDSKTKVGKMKKETVEILENDGAINTTRSKEIVFKTTDAKKEKETVKNEAINTTRSKEIVGKKNLENRTKTFKKELVFHEYSCDSTETEAMSVGKKIKKIVWLNHYNNLQKILLVGEGDFSFSTSLAMAFGSSASNITATSFDSTDFLLRNYPNAMQNVAELRSRKVTVLHNVNATTMSNHSYLRRIKFDRIIFNFPYFGSTMQEPCESSLRKNRELIRGFISNAKEMIVEEGGEIHITHKTKGFYLEWDVKKLARSEDLLLVKEVDFNVNDYNGYETTFGFKGDSKFNAYPSKTYMFSL